MFAPFLLWNDTNNKIFTNNKKISTNNINYSDKYENRIDLMNEAYFSEYNIDYIQKAIIIKVYNDSGKQIVLKPQKYELLIQLMNSFWVNNCKYLPYNYKEQIEELNNLVINYATESLIKEAYFHLNYLKDRKNRELLETPKNTKKKRNI